MYKWVVGRESDRLRIYHLSEYPFDPKHSYVMLFDEKIHDEIEIVSGRDSFEDRPRKTVK
jgi:hypothetical protein